MIEAAARAGVKGILCEKPLVASVPQLRRVERVVRETGAKMQVFDLATLLHEAVERGKSQAG